ncbi:flagellar biosynthetic protein FliO [Aureimonas fodinaquatilis]|nr:flagellar biosynthetic protein FliO [Aureimonas fodinaquatilis]
MFEGLVNALGGAGIASAVAVILAIAAILIIGYFIYALFRSLTGSGRLHRGRNAQPRVAVLDMTPVDQKRQLVLIRRDEVEHLVLIGGLNDVLIESGIVRQPAGRRIDPAFANESSAAPKRAEPEPVAMPRAPAAQVRKPAAAPAPAPVAVPVAPVAQEVPEPRLETPAEPTLTVPQAAPQVQPPRPVQPPRSMATPTLPTARPAPQAPESSGTMQLRGTTGIPQQAAPAAAEPAEFAKSESTEPTPAPQPLQVRSFASNVQIPRQQPLTAKPAATAPAVTPPAPSGNAGASKNDIESFLTAELNTRSAAKSAQATTPAPAATAQPEKPEPEAARKEATKMPTLEDEMDALLRDFTLESPERR